MNEPATRLDLGVRFGSPTVERGTRSSGRADPARSRHNDRSLRRLERRRDHIDDPTTTVRASTNTVPTASAKVAAQPSQGCGSSAAAGTTVTLQPVIDGRTRVAIVHLPVGYHSGTPAPLVLSLHGSGSTAAEQVAFTGMNATADQDGFIVVYPQGDLPAGSGFDWNVPNEPLVGGSTVPANAPDDVSFIQQLVTLLEQRYCIDEHRVFATGFSGGARMTSQLGCDASGTFAAVAPVSGLRIPTPCSTTRAVPVISFHGTADPVDPYNGNGEAYWTYSVPMAAQRWAAQDGCSPSAQTTNPSSHLKVTSYGHCQDGAAVELDTVVGDGHEWPGARGSLGASPASAVRSPMPWTPTRPCGPSSSPIRCSGRSRDRAVECRRHTERVEQRLFLHEGVSKRVDASKHCGLCRIEAVTNGKSIGRQVRNLRLSVVVPHQYLER